MRIDPEAVQTNIVVFEVDDSEAFQRRLGEVGVLTSGFGPPKVRMVTHYGITREDIDETLERVRHVSAIVV